MDEARKKKSDEDEQQEEEEGQKGSERGDKEIDH